MATDALSKKWKLVKPKHFEGFLYVMDVDFNEVDCCVEDDINECHCGAGMDVFTVMGKDMVNIAAHVIHLHNNYIDNLNKEKK